MVGAYAAIANGGHFVQPMFVYREERAGQFEPVREAAEALPRPQALELVNVMRGVVDEGTGSGHPKPLRNHRGRGRQDRHHAGEYRWLGSWGQGARSALPMVGEVFQQALRNRWIDSRAGFDIPHPRSAPRSEPEQERELHFPRPE
jgi:penicillin-binding protein 1A